MGDFERWIYVGFFSTYFVAFVIARLFCRFAAILTALLNDVPTLSLTQLNIEKLDEEENASITCELIFQLNRDK